MSDPGGEPREWRFYDEDMIGFCEKVRTYTAGLNRDTFVTGGMAYDATLRNLELIGEAATHVPESVRNAYPEIPWRAIIGARNRLAHGYLHIEDDTVWNMIEDAVPQLVSDLRELLKRAGENAE
ncbi:MAG: DUF86 domain-containing protein [Rhodospirillaceae bacterium]|nr:DUF86 domain-containing protein [Rhodospirillaceae bacterium]MDE0255526.1 DUF86 domain-containing protein [Rhodospirillaceae bacterium]MDE0616642.1 DUF86 domain-containing protein [Rhodospirillaceae bacterium]